MTAPVEARVTSLPPLPESVVQLQRLCRDPGATSADIAELLAGDPMLTAGVLRAANSPLYGLRGQVASVQHAVTMLGTAMVRGLVMAAAMRRAMDMDMRPYGMTNGAFANLSALQSATALHWLVHEQPHDLDLLTTASFIMELGKILVADAVLRADLLDDFQQELAASTDVEAVERALVGVDSRELAASMFEHWGFESELVAVVRHMSNATGASERQRHHALALRAVAACASVRGLFEPAGIERATSLVLSMGGNLDRFLAAVDVVAGARRAGGSS